MKAATPVFERGGKATGTVFEARRKEVSRAELDRTLGSVLARWIAATCLWGDDWSIGDHRFVVFSTGHSFAARTTFPDR